MSTVRGEIRLPSDPTADSADVIIQIEDVSRADAPSEVIGEQRQGRVPLRAGEALAFAVDVPSDRVDARSSYSVRVHLDVSGSGDVESGDYVSTRSYPVLTQGYGEFAAVDVQRV